MNRVFSFLSIEGRVSKIDVFLIHALLGELDSFAEVINLSKSPGAQCLQGFRGFFGVGKTALISPYFWLFRSHHAATSPINSTGSGLL